MDIIVDRTNIKKDIVSTEYICNIASYRLYDIDYYYKKLIGSGLDLIKTE